MASPQKPWEQAGSAAVQQSTITTAAPEVPSRPAALNNTGMVGNNSMYGGGIGYGGGMGGYGGNMGTYGSGMGTYGGYGGYSGYSGYGGGYGNTYGGYGGGMGMGRFGGMGGMGGMYNRRMDGDPTFTQQMELSTQSTFQTLDQIVQAFGGFAQMLESTFFATHSSFMAMMGVAEQFGNLRSYLGQVLSIVSVFNMIKRAGYLITGRKPPIDADSINSNSFTEFGKPAPSKKPLFVFLSLIIGLPWLLSKLMQKIEQNRPKLLPTDIKNLEFCKAQYDFQSDSPGELSFRKGDLIAILTKIDHNWWRGRTQDGRMGLFPQNYVQIIQKTNPELKPSPISPVDVRNPVVSSPAAGQFSNLINIDELSKAPINTHEI